MTASPRTRRLRGVSTALGRAHSTGPSFLAGCRRLRLEVASDNRYYDPLAYSAPRDGEGATFFAFSVALPLPPNGGRGRRRGKARRPALELVGWQSPPCTGLETRKNTFH